MIMIFRVAAFLLLSLGAYPAWSCGFGVSIAANQCRGYLLYPNAGSTWTVPNDWTSSNTITVRGAGGGGRSGDPAGGGGAIASISNLSLSRGGSIAIQVGPPGAGGAAGAGADGTTGGDTFFNRTAGTAGTCADTTSVCAQGGAGGGAPGGGGGAAASGTGTIKHSGGLGPQTPNNATSGGGGAGNLCGDGQAGGSGTTGTTYGGSGGGSNGNGNAGVAAAASNAGAAGGASVTCGSQTGASGGTGAASASVAGGPGSAGSGGGGGYGDGGSNSTAGGPGGNGTDDGGNGSANVYLGLAYAPNGLTGTYPSMTFAGGGMSYNGTTGWGYTPATISGNPGSQFVDQEVFTDQNHLAIKYNGYYWNAMSETTVPSFVSTGFYLFRSTDLQNWSYVQTVSCGTSQSYCWPVKFYDDDSGNMHAIVSSGTSIGSGGNMVPYELHPTTSDPGSTWSSGVALTGTALPSDSFDCRLERDGTSTRYLFCALPTSPQHIQLMTSTSDFTGYNTLVSSNLLGGSNTNESPEALNIAGTWYLFVYAGAANGQQYYTASSLGSTSWAGPNSLGLSPLLFDMSTIFKGPAPIMGSGGGGGAAGTPNNAGASAPGGNGGYYGGGGGSSAPNASGSRGQAGNGAPGEIEITYYTSASTRLLIGVGR